MAKAPKSRPKIPTPAPATLPDLSGKKLGDFELLRKLGQGGMGQVYLAEQISLKRKVALKVLRPDISSRPEALKRFKAEAEAVARATHANIVQVYSIGQDQGISFMALEYVEGKTLREFLSKKGNPDLLIALSIMRQVASALQRASELGITHRDIKPENILLTRKGEVKVADFGLSRCLEVDGKALDLTQTGVTMGTPMYMSPEQVQGQPVDPRSDIYSFGVTCYQMFAGHTPFKGQTAFEVAIQHVQKEPPPLKEARPDLPDAVCAIVHKMMHKSPEQRYQTAREVSRDILRIREGLSGVSQTGMASVTGDPNTDLMTLSPSEGNGATEQLPALPEVLPLEESIWTRHRTWLVVGGAATLVLALSVGMAFAWRERAREGPLPVGETIRPGDAVAVEKLDRPSKKEQDLKTAAETYLSKPRGTPGELANGLKPCMDLAIYYLDNDKLKEAEALFHRLETFQNPTFHGLGEIGRGIVLALQNDAVASNQVFHDIFTPPPALVPGDKSGGKGPGGKGPFSGIGKSDKDKFGKIPGTGRPRRSDTKDQLSAINQVLNDSRWQYYLIRARDQNRKNGIAERDMPGSLLQRLRDARSGKRL